MPSHFSTLLALLTLLGAHRIPPPPPQIIRETGAVLGRVTYQNETLPFANPNETNLVAAVSTKAIKVFGAGQSPKILMLDCGIKFNIIRYFVDVQKVSQDMLRSFCAVGPHVRACGLPVPSYITPKLFFLKK